MEFLRGTEVVTGTTGNGSSGSAIFTDASATFQTSGVVAGDTVYIASEGTFLVSSVDSETQITLDSNLSQNLVDVRYRIARDPIDSSDIKSMGQDGNNSWFVIYDATDFAVG